MLFCHLNNCRLRTGWSTGKPTATLDPAEREAILDVIRRNEQLEVAERQRVGKLVERVEKIKERAAECGPRNCRCECLEFAMPIGRRNLYVSSCV